MLHDYPVESRIASAPTIAKDSGSALAQAQRKTHLPNGQHRALAENLLGAVLVRVARQGDQTILALPSRALIQSFPIFSRKPGNLRAEPYTSIAPNRLQNKSPNGWLLLACSKCQKEGLSIHEKVDRASLCGPLPCGKKAA